MSRKKMHQNYSTFIGPVSNRLLEERKQKALVAKYIEGYRRQPETMEEIPWALPCAVQLFSYLDESSE